MKPSLIVTSLMCFALASCGKGVPKMSFGDAAQRALSFDATDRCTEVIATNGALLTFCQANQKVTIYESGADASDITGSLSVANNPEAIRELQSRIPARKDLIGSRQLVSRSCVIKGKEYVNISVADLKRILRASGLDVVAGPVAAPENSPLIRDPRSISSRENNTDAKQ